MVRLSDSNCASSVDDRDDGEFSSESRLTPSSAGDGQGAMTVLKIRLTSNVSSGVIACMR